MPSCCGSLVPPSTATEYNLGLAGFADSGCPGVSRGCGRGGGAGCVQARVHLNALEAVRLREQLDEALGESKFELAVRVLDDVARHYVAPAKEVAVMVGTALVGIVSGQVLAAITATRALRAVLPFCGFLAGLALLIRGRCANARVDVAMDRACQEVTRMLAPAAHVTFHAYTFGKAQVKYVRFDFDPEGEVAPLARVHANTGDI